MTANHEEAAEGRAKRRVPAGERWRLWSRRVGLGRVVVVATVSLALGILLGRLSTPAGHDEARRVLEATIVPMALDADTEWTGSTDDGFSIAEGLLALRRDGDPDPVRSYGPRWLESYDRALVRMTGVELPPDARPVQRQFIASVTLSRDAVEVLLHAANVDDAALRRTLTSEVVRLRQRSEHLGQVARSALRDMEGPGGDVTRLPVLPTFDELQ